MRTSADRQSRGSLEVKAGKREKRQRVETKGNESRACLLLRSKKKSEADGKGLRVEYDCFVPTVVGEDKLQALFVAEAQRTYLRPFYKRQLRVFFDVEGTLLCELSPERKDRFQRIVSVVPLCCCFHWRMRISIRECDLTLILGVSGACAK
jgi:hypothetical protein